MFLLTALLETPTEARTLGPFELAFAGGVWAFSQGDAPEAMDFFQQAVRLRPENGFARYMLGLSHLRLGRAREAVAEIAASLKAQVPPPVRRSRVLADFGAAQLAAGETQAALETLEEALGDRQDDAVALYHYAKALDLVGRKEEAEAARASARRLRPELDPEDLLVEFPPVLLPARGSQDAPRWSGAVNVMSGRDSNPNLLSREIFLPTPAADTELVSGGSADSVASGDLRVTYAPDLTAKGWSLAVDLRMGGSLHRDFDYLNLIRTGAVIQLGRGADSRGFLEGPLGANRVDVAEKADRWTVLLQGGLQEYRLDSASYLRTLDAAGSLTLSTSEANATRLDIQLQSRNYYHHPLADPRRSGEEARLGVRQSRYFDRPQNRYVALEVFAAQRNAGDEFDRALLGAEVEAETPIGARWTLNLLGSFNREDFNDSRSNLFNPSGPRRGDRTWGAEAGLSFDFTDRLRLLVRGTYDDRDSSLDLGQNLPDLDYRRSTLSTGIAWVF